MRMPVTNVDNILPGGSLQRRLPALAQRLRPSVSRALQSPRRSHSNIRFCRESRRGQVAHPLAGVTVYAWQL